MGNLTGFLNAMARNGVLFLLVFYFQGARGEDPVTAGIMLAPLAIGLIVLSPISGVLADRYGSRALATLGMVITALGAGRPDDNRSDHGLLAARPVAADRRSGLGIFNSPNTSAVMGVVPPHKRGVGAGTANDADAVRVRRLDRTGDRARLGPRWTRRCCWLSFPARRSAATASASRRSSNALHLAFLAGVVASVLGALVSLMRGEHRSYERRRPAPPGPGRGVEVGAGPR